jgi:two-component system sensor histidine kinase PilS (NtrC family)
MNSQLEITLGIEEKQRLQHVAVIRIYNYYRILVSFLLLFLFLQPEDERWVGTINPDLYQITVLIYIGANIIIGLASLLIKSEIFDRTASVFTLLTLDIIALTILMYASGGVSSGLGNFLLFTVAFGGGLISGRISTVLPAIAFILCIYDESYLFFLNESDTQSFFQAGLLGIVFFAANILFQYLSRQLRERESEVFSLEKLSQTVINRMRIGVLVVSRDGTIHLINRAAEVLLALEARTKSKIAYLPAHIKAQLELWNKNQGKQLSGFKTDSSGPEILAQFSRVTPSKESDYLVFLEDSTDIQQQAQQLKLAALGRLSAIIAHEVRNPLGAISHAAQLLGESSSLEPEDVRLIEIVQNHSIRMNGVVENVLEMSRRKSAEPQTIVLNSWLEHFVEDYTSGSTEGMNIEVEVVPDVDNIEIDPVHLSQALSNLCENGLRYSLRNIGKAKIKLLAATDPITKTTHLDVIDYGRGVDEEQVQNLFEPFYTTETNGTGLGLHLSKELCEANHARLGYHRTEAGGSCFRISFV